MFLRCHDFHRFLFHHIFLSHWRLIWLPLGFCDKDDEKLLFQFFWSKQCLFPTVLLSGSRRLLYTFEHNLRRDVRPELTKWQIVHIWQLKSLWNGHEYVWILRSFLLLCCNHSVHDLSLSRAAAEKKCFHNIIYSWCRKACLFSVLFFTPSREPGREAQKQDGTDSGDL